MDKKVSEIAKELDVKPGVVINKLKEMGISVDTIASTVTLNQENALLDHMGIKRKVTTKKVTKVTTDGNKVTKKKVVVKAGAKKKDAANKSDTSEKGGSKVDAKKTAKPVNRKKIKVTVIKKHKEDEIEEEKLAVEKDTKEQIEEKPKTKVEIKKEDAPKPQKTQEIKKEDAPKTPKAQELKKEEVPKTEKEAKPIKTKETIASDEKKSADSKSVTKTKPKKKQEKKKPAAIKKEDIKEEKPEKGHKLGLTGKIIAIPGKTPIRSKKPSRVARPKKDVDLKLPDVDFDSLDEKPRVPKNVIKSTYNKPSFSDKKQDFTERKTPSIKQSYTNPRTKKYRNNQIVGAVPRRVKDVMSDEFILNEYYSNDNIRRRRSTSKNKHKPKREVLTNVNLPETMTVKHFAEIIKKQSSDVMKKLMELGVMVAINEEIDFDTAALVADEYNITAELVATITEEDILFEDEDEINEENLVERAPVVVVMGHVDHGKTSLLDTIKNTNVAATEAGAITQHVGAYRVSVNDRKITFLDTPGHEAFTSMRKRGALATDIAIIVVAADDGIMPQTVEALNHAKEAGVAIVVAINKIDLPAANPDRVKQELTEYGIVPEEWGGDVICVPVSAKTGENIENLLEMVLLTADILELKEDPTRQAKGIVIESKLDIHRGTVATILVQQGTLYDDDVVISGVSVGRIRTMNDENGVPVKEAGPSVPVVITGLDEVPESGETFYGVEDEKTARSLAERRKYEKQQEIKVKTPTNLDELFGQIQDGSVKELKLIVKGDVRGSVEAVTESLEKLTNEEVTVKVIHGAVGTITESDVTLAEVANAIIIGFNVRPGNNVSEAAKLAGVDIRLYRIIYEAVDSVEAAIKGMLDPIYQEKVTGHAEIRQIFKSSGVGTIGGCMVTDGKIKRASDIRLVRNGIVVYEGKLESLKRFQDDVREVQSGYECGISVEKYNDIKVGDVIEAYEMVEIEE